MRCTIVRTPKWFLVKQGDVVLHAFEDERSAEEYVAWVGDRDLVAA